MVERSSTECNSRETHNVYPNLNPILLNDQGQFKLNKSNAINDYIVVEVKERKRINDQNLVILINHCLLYL